MNNKSQQMHVTNFMITGRKAVHHRRCKRWLWRLIKRYKRYNEETCESAKEKWLTAVLQRSSRNTREVGLPRLFRKMYAYICDETPFQMNTESLSTSTSPVSLLKFVVDAHIFIAYNSGWYGWKKAYDSVSLKKLLCRQARASMEETSLDTVRLAAVETLTLPLWQRHHPAHITRWLKQQATAVRDYAKTVLLRFNCGQIQHVEGKGLNLGRGLKWANMTVNERPPSFIRL